MRVTQNISNGMYLRNTRRIDSSMLKSMNRIMTQRRFNRVSEDVINGVKALSVRRQLRDVKIYRDNLNASQEFLSSAEHSLMTMSGKIYPQMESELVAASNGTYDQLELDIFALNFDQMAEEMVKTLNADFAERQIFGGTNNGVAPFSIEQAIITVPRQTQMTATNEAGDTVRVFTNAEGEQVYFTEEEWADVEDKENYTPVMIAEQLTKEVDGEQKFVFTDAEGKEVYFSQEELDGMSDDEKKQYTPVFVKDVVYPPNWKDYYKEDEVRGGVAVKDGELQLQDGITMDDIPKSVLYNGVPVNFDVLTNKFEAGTYTVSTLGLNDKGQKAFTDSSFELTEEARNTALNKHDNSLIFPGSKPIYVDIGIGIKYSLDGKVDPQTALDVALNGAAITGSGMDDGGFSKNIIQLALDTAYHLRKGINVATEMDLTKANDGIKALDDDIRNGREPDMESINKTLAEAKIGATLTKNENGDYIIKVYGQEVYNSSKVADYDPDNLPELTAGESSDAEYVVLDVSGGGSIKLSKCIGDQSYVNAVIDRANDANSNVLKQITTLGIKQNTIDFYMDRMTDTEFNLKERQNLVEGTDMNEEITHQYNLEAAYQAAMKMGSWVLPKSIFDFI